jgi:hypothetical protein
MQLAIGNPPEIGIAIRNGVIRKKSHFRKATYLPTAILTSSDVNGGQDVLLG